MRICSRWISVLVSSSFAGAEASAQDISASIHGIATDETGAAVTGARVTAVQDETGLQRSTESDGQGAYVLLQLPVGHYRLEAEAKGFKNIFRKEFPWSEESATVAVHLLVGMTTQEIEVKSDALMIESTSTNLGQTVGEREILDLPLNGRQFTQLGLLQTGVVPLTPGLLEAGGSLRVGKLMR